MKKPPVSPVPMAPLFRAIPFLKPSAAGVAPLLTDREREELARIGVRVRLPARMVIYEEDSPAESLFAIQEGVVKSFGELPSGKRIVSTFLFARDLFGLAKNGRYVNTTQAVTPVILYRLPLRELAVLLKHDAEMQFKFLVKVTHELREAQHRSILINRRDAAGRLAMFIALLAEHRDQAAGAVQLVPLPMNRTDIAGYLGLSLESVSRAAAQLERKGIVKFENRHLVRITNPSTLAKLAAAV